MVSGIRIILPRLIYFFVSLKAGQNFGNFNPLQPTYCPVGQGELLSGFKSTAHQRLRAGETTEARNVTQAP